MKKCIQVYEKNKLVGLATIDLPNNPSRFSVHKIEGKPFSKILFIGDLEYGVVLPERENEEIPVALPWREQRKKYISRDEFEKQYCAIEEITLGQYYNERNLITLPCNCKGELCQGWKAVNNTPRDIKKHTDMYMKGE
jgi:hypothetical protein